MTEPIRFQIEVPVQRNWRNIELLRTSVLNCLATVFHSHDYCQTVSMIASELLENAVKYGEWEDRDRNSFRLRVDGDDGGVQVEVCNPVDPASPELEAVLATVAAIQEHSAPEVYRQRLATIAAQGPDEQASGLGLVRIAYEGECRLEAQVEGDVLRVRAIAVA